VSAERVLTNWNVPNGSAVVRLQIRVLNVTFI